MGKFIDMTGWIMKEHGIPDSRITVLYRDSEKTNDGHIKWVCKCECGNICEFTSHHLLDGKIKSCGCLSSLGEKRIKDILIENNIKFEHDKCYRPLLEDTKRALRFDFIIYDDANNILRFIEFDGPQHDKNFKESSQWSDEELKLIQERDKIKNEWCLKNNYILVRIPYNRLNKICLEDIMGNHYIYKGDD